MKMYSVLLAGVILGSFWVQTPIWAQDNPNNPTITDDTQFKDIYEQFYTAEEKDHPLRLRYEDVFFQPVKEDGKQYIDIIIRKRNKFMNSVLLINPVPGQDCNSRINRAGEFSNIDYGLRALEYNKVNGDEKRYYQGKFLGKADGLNFLVDSKPEENTVFGDIFRVRVPLYVRYGYQHGDEFGLLRMEDKSPIIIRTYIRQYADYRGKYYDNCFIIDTESFEKGRIQNFRILEESIDRAKIGNNEYMVVTAQFTGRTKFFSFFTVVDERPTPQTINVRTKNRIGYLTQPKDVNSDFVILMESLYQNGYKFVRARIYLRKGQIERQVQLNVMDSNGVEAIRPLMYRVPVKGSTVPSIQPNNEKVERERVLTQPNMMPYNVINPDTGLPDPIIDNDRY